MSIRTSFGNRSRASSRIWPFAEGKIRNGDRNSLALETGSRVAVIGGGPAGSFFSYFLLDLAQRVGIELHLDIYEPRDFSISGPAGCNMCGGIISESLVQALATEGINLPASVVERAIDSYVLHMPEGTVRIATPLEEKRIAAVHRGAGPRGMKETKWRSFDGYVLGTATAKGARVVRARVDHVGRKDGKLEVKTVVGEPQTYDLVGVAVGVNTAALKIFEQMEFGYHPPQATKTYISEFYLGQETVEQYLGSSMHVFLLSLPRLEFAALIPKGDYVTLCLLGEEIDAPLVQSLLDSAEVKQCMPPGWRPPKDFCHCSPRINVRMATHPFTDRMVFMGDCGATRLYKDGIGAAYRTAKTAAVTAIFDGISAEDFRRRYWPACQAIARDNLVGKLIFAFTGLQQKNRHDRVGILRMVSREQRNGRSSRRMSMVMWDMFTGSASYREVFFRTLHPFFWARLVWEVIVGVLKGTGPLKQSK